MFQIRGWKCSNILATIFSTPYKFSGKEIEQETGYSYFGARYYLGTAVTAPYIWGSVDPFADKKPWITPYAYCMNNPLRYVDPDGRDIYEFDVNGNFSKKIPQKGQHVGRILGKNGSVTDFKFADPKNDPKSIDKGDITTAYIVSNESINEALLNSGVFDKNNQDDRYSYIKNQSNASYGDGKMDYLITADFSLNGRQRKGISGNALYITETESGHMGHNNYNFGNFLWGAGAKALGFSEVTARAGAHLNNFLNDKDNIGQPFYKRSFDSRDDQRSIRTGFQWMRENRRR